jgi:hypothetical protein
MELYHRDVQHFLWFITPRDLSHDPVENILPD